MRNIHKVREMLAQIGGACVQITLGCQEAQNEPDDEQVFLSLQELEHAFGELHKHAQQLAVMASSDTIDPELDHDGDTQPGGLERPQAIEILAETLFDDPELGAACEEDDASCDCNWHENLRAALASGGGVTR